MGKKVWALTFAILGVLLFTYLLISGMEHEADLKPTPQPELHLAPSPTPKVQTFEPETESLKSLEEEEQRLPEKEWSLDDAPDLSWLTANETYIDNLSEFNVGAKLVTQYHDDAPINNERDREILAYVDGFYQELLIGKKNKLLFERSKIECKQTFCRVEVVVEPEWNFQPIQKQLHSILAKLQINGVRAFEWIHVKQTERTQHVYLRVRRESKGEKSDD